MSSPESETEENISRGQLSDKIVEIHPYYENGNFESLGSTVSPERRKLFEVMKRRHIVTINSHIKDCIWHANSKIIVIIWVGRRKKCFWKTAISIFCKKS